jgi:hypothetical protein
MSIELITGRSGTAHISANDYRAINRANYGPGRYILKDDENMEVSVIPSTSSLSTVYVTAGSCLWSGMHIRCAEPSTISYITPTSAETVYVYLHYVKDAGTLIETVEWVISVGKELSPIVDNLSDSTTEAYTEFCSFLSTATTANVRFQLVDAHTDFDLETINSNIAAAQTAAKEYTDTKAAEIDDKIDVVDNKISSFGETVVLSTEYKDLSEEEVKLWLNEPISYFRFICFVWGASWSDRAYSLVPTDELVMENYAGFYNKAIATDGDNVLVVGFNARDSRIEFEKMSSALKIRKIIGYK